MDLFLGLLPQKITDAILKILINILIVYITHVNIVTFILAMLYVVPMMFLSLLAYATYIDVIHNDKETYNVANAVIITFVPGINLVVFIFVICCVVLSMSRKNA